MTCPAIMSRTARRGGCSRVKSPDCGYFSRLTKVSGHAGGDHGYRDGGADPDRRGGVGGRRDRGRPSGRSCCSPAARAAPPQARAATTTTSEATAPAPRCNEPPPADHSAVRRTGGLRAVPPAGRSRRVAQSPGQQRDVEAAHGSTLLGLLLLGGEQVHQHRGQPNALQPSSGDHLVAGAVPGAAAAVGEQQLRPLGRPRSRRPPTPPRRSGSAPPSRYPWSPPAWPETLVNRLKYPQSGDFTREQPPRLAVLDMIAGHVIPDGACHLRGFVASRRSVSAPRSRETRTSAEASRDVSAGSVSRARASGDVGRWSFLAPAVTLRSRYGRMSVQ